MVVVRVWYRGQFRHGHLTKQGRKWDYIRLPEGDRHKTVKVVKDDYIILNPGAILSLEQRRS